MVFRGEVGSNGGKEDCVRGSRMETAPWRPGCGEFVVNEAKVATSKKALNTGDEFGLGSPQESVREDKELYQFTFAV